ncbi:TIGR01777 family oxidoreductase [Paenibacillus sp. YYML68]|uniref:TIGR01777 family oxidoreductase n=1 Tax=Paenibacillus sp. YYML68 TaxID=2909250 RepID=UPI002491BDC1|nr:TIGR01777 family oxidoreductase [Paenibacillus sp. YYML68]
MKVAITGGTGFIGKHLIQHFLQQKISVVVVSRQKQKSEHPLIRYTTYAELEERVQPLDGVDAIVNLAGESINQRWTSEAKKRILQSRLDAVAAVSSWIERLEHKPVLINASGIAIYGTSDDDTFIEESEWKKDDFLSSVVDQWEAAAEIIADTRVVLLRLGLVLGKDGGAFPRMVTPFKLGLGGRVGTGKQIISWIHITDLCRLIQFCIEQEDLEGPVNATSPVSVTNEEFGRKVASKLGKPFMVPAPAFLMKLMFGDMSELLLKGQRVFPAVAIQRNFQYNYPILELALDELLPEKKSSKALKEGSS